MNFSMKNLLLTFFIVASSTLSAQMCPCEFGKGDSIKPKRFEIGLNVFNAQEVLVNFYQQNPEYSLNYLNGIQFKYHLNKFSFRAGMDLLYHKYDYEVNDPMNYNKNVGENNGYNIRLGLERSFIEKYFNLYYALDLLYHNDKYKGVSEGSGDIRPYYIDNYEFDVQAFGVSPAFGIRFRPIKQISIGLETSLSIIRFKSTKVKGGYEDEKSTTLLFNPLRIASINFHF